jgi:hypothetical protein
MDFIHLNASQEKIMKKTMTINLTDVEMSVLDELCAQKGLSKTALVRQALRLYKSVDQRLEQGDKVFVENSDKTEKAELMVL